MKHPRPITFNEQLQPIILTFYCLTSMSFNPIRPGGGGGGGGGGGAFDARANFE